MEAAKVYPHEIEQYIAERHGVLSPDEVKFVTDITLHPQLNHITYNPWECSYDMWDNTGNHYHFKINI